MSLKRREINEPFYDAHLELFKCTFPNCQVTSRKCHIPNAILGDEEILNASVTSETVEVFDVSMSVVDKETPIYKVLETSRPEDLQSRTINFGELQQQINNHLLIEHNDSVDCLSESIIKKLKKRNDERLKVIKKNFRL